MRISDWSSDVCSSDLRLVQGDLQQPWRFGERAGRAPLLDATGRRRLLFRRGAGPADPGHEGLGPRDTIGGWCCAALRRESMNSARQSQSNGEQHGQRRGGKPRSEEHTSELQSLMRITYAVFCLKKKTK